MIKVNENCLLGRTIMNIINTRKKDRKFFSIGLLNYKKRLKIIFLKRATSPNPGEAR
jgi:hypothetical protein